MKSKTQLNIAGTLLFLAGSIIIIGIITGEIFFPTGYNTFTNEISDLGGTRPPNSIIHEPSATIFNTTMLVSGLMVFIAALFVHKQFKQWLFTIPFTIFGFSVFGVGFFPGHVIFWHGIFALAAFTFGSITCITAYKNSSISIPLRRDVYRYNIINLFIWCQYFYPLHRCRWSGTLGGLPGCVLADGVWWIFIGYESRN